MQQVVLGFGFTEILRLWARHCAGADFDTGTCRQLEITESHHNELTEFGTVLKPLTKKKQRMPVQHRLHCFRQLLVNPFDTVTAHCLARIAELVNGGLPLIQGAF